MIKNWPYKIPIANKKGVIIRELYKYPTNPPIYVEKCIASGNVRRILIGKKEEVVKKQSNTSKLKDFFVKLLNKII